MHFVLRVLTQTHSAQAQPGSMGLGDRSVRNDGRRGGEPGHGWTAGTRRPSCCGQTVGMRASSINRQQRFCPPPLACMGHKAPTLLGLLRCWMFLDPPGATAESLPCWRRRDHGLHEAQPSRSASYRLLHDAESTAHKSSHTASQSAKAQAGRRTRRTFLVSVGAGSRSWSRRSVLWKCCYRHSCWQTVRVVAQVNCDLSRTYSRFLNGSRLGHTMAVVCPTPSRLPAADDMAEAHRTAASAMCSFCEGKSTARTAKV